MAYFLQRKYLQKPRQWGPISAVRSAVLEWCGRHGMSPPIYYAPCWDGAGQFPSDIMGILGAYSIIESADTSWRQHQWLQLNSSNAAGALIRVNGGAVGQSGTLCFRGILAGPYLYNRRTSPIGFRRYGVPYNGGEMYLEVRQAGSVGDIWIASPGVPAADSGINIPGFDQYFSIIQTYTGSNHKIYVDGAYSAQQAYSTTFNTNTSFNVFCHESLDPNQPWYGMCDHGIFFNTVLTDDQIAVLADDPYGMIQPRSVPIYSFASITAGTAEQGDSFVFAVSDADASGSGTRSAAGTILASSAVAVSGTPVIASAPVVMAASSADLSGQPGIGAAVICSGVADISTEAYPSRATSIDVPATASVQTQSACARSAQTAVSALGTILSVGEAVEIAEGSGTVSVSAVSAAAISGASARHSEINLSASASVQTQSACARSASPAVSAVGAVSSVGEAVEVAEGTGTTAVSAVSAAVVAGASARLGHPAVAAWATLIDAGASVRGGATVCGALSSVACIGTAAEANSAIVATEAAAAVEVAGIPERDGAVVAGDTASIVIAGTSLRYGLASVSAVSAVTAAGISGDAGMGAIIDPTIESITVARAIVSVTVRRSIHYM